MRSSTASERSWRRTRSPSRRTATPRPSSNPRPSGATVRLASGTRLRRLSLRRSVTIIGDGAEIRADVGGTCVLDVRPGATDVRISGLRVTAAPGVSINDLVCLGHGDDTQTALDQQPRRITFTGNTVVGNGLTKRGIAIHGADITVLDNRVLNIARVGQDSSAIGGWNGEGRWTIENNEIEGASENILIGGADPSIVGLVPTDITIRGNHLYKRLAWRGAGVGVKNLLELKTGRRVRIENNLLEFNWVDGQTGWGIVLTPSQYGTNPRNSLEDIDIVDNVLRETGGGINLLGSGQNSVTGITKRVHVSGNYIATDRATYGGQGWILQVGRSPEDVELTQNTIEMPGSGQLVVVTDGVVEGLTITRNAVRPIGTYWHHRPRQQEQSESRQGIRHLRARWHRDGQSVFRRPRGVQVELPRQHLCDDSARCQRRTDGRGVRHRCRWMGRRRSRAAAEIDRVRWLRRTSPSVRDGVAEAGGRIAVSGRVAWISDNEGRTWRFSTASTAR